MLILDTHTWIWLITGDEKIRKAGFLPAIEKAEMTKSIKIPAICAWEIAMLTAKNRLSVDGDVLDWIKQALSAPGISLCPLTPEIACESCNLPGHFHGDPADRMIVASARILNGTLLTFDQKIINYAHDGFVQILNPKKNPF